MNEKNGTYIGTIRYIEEAIKLIDKELENK